MSWAAVTRQNLSTEMNKFTVVILQFKYFSTAVTVCEATATLGNSVVFLGLNPGIYKVLYEDTFKNNPTEYKERKKASLLLTPLTC